MYYYYIDDGILPQTKTLVFLLLHSVKYEKGLYCRFLLCAHAPFFQPFDFCFSSFDFKNMAGSRLFVQEMLTFSYQCQASALPLALKAILVNETRC